MQVYLVGGAVRDKLLGRSVNERDYVVVGSTEQQMLAQGFTRVGKDFPVFLHPKTQEEYALARTERKRGHGYHGFECHADPHVTLEQDLIRRDLTINAIAQDKDGKLIDPYGGKTDLADRVFRHVSGAFIEDPLRVFRVARFYARYKGYGFTIAAETQSLMQQMSSAKELSAIAAERIWQETQRAINEPFPFDYFVVLAHAGAANYWFSELQLEQIGERIVADNVNVNDALQTQSLAAEQRFAIVFARLFELSQWDSKASQLEALSSLTKRLKVPNSYTDLLRLVLSETDVWSTASPCADSLLQSFNRIDLWRRPERAALIQDCLCVLQPSLHEQLKGIQKAAESARTYDVQTIIAQGIKGAAIKPRLEQARLERIKGELDQLNCASK